MLQYSATKYSAAGLLMSTWSLYAVRVNITVQRGSTASTVPVVVWRHWGEHVVHQLQRHYTGCGRLPVNMAAELEALAHTLYPVLQVGIEGIALDVHDDSPHTRDLTHGRTTQTANRRKLLVKTP